MDISTFIMIFFGFITLLGFIIMSGVNKLIKKYPSLEKYFIGEDIDRNGNPIEEDF